jgi:hypothetical protein
MSRIFAIVLDPEKNNDEKFEILNTTFLPEENTVVILKQDSKIIKASVLKVESVLERIGDSADLTFNIFLKIVPPEEDVN